MAYVPRDEQEVILSYDRELDEWHYYGDVPSLNRRWRKQVEPTKEIVEGNGIIALLEGKILGVVSVNSKRKRRMSEVQRRAAAERMRKLRQSQIDSKANAETN